MITGIIMASGFSRRLGENKLLIEIDGLKLIEKIIIEGKKSKLDRTILIYREDIIKNIGDKYNIESFKNNNADLGQSESMKIGIENSSVDSHFMFLVGDQVFLNSNIIDKLIDVHKENINKIIVPNYNSKRGMPTIFPSTYRKKLLDTDGDKGGRDIILKDKDNIININLDKKYGFDIDTKEDLLKIREIIGG